MRAASEIGWPTAEGYYSILWYGGGRSMPPVRTIARWEENGFWYRKDGDLYCSGPSNCAAESVEWEPIVIPAEMPCK